MWKFVMAKGATAAELVDQAHRLGYREVSTRLVHDWVGLGLLDKPMLLSEGRRGRKGYFDETQSELFFVLLAERARRGAGRHIITYLCNAPVLVWLWCGSGCIPLRQTRRALLTWASVKADSWRRCVNWAYQALEPFGWPRRPGRPPTLVHRLATLLYRGQISRATLAAALREALSQVPTPPESWTIQQWISKSPRPEPTSESPVQLVDEVARTIGTRHETCRRIAEIPDTMFEWARITHLWKYPMYLAHRLELPRIPTPLDILGPLAMHFDEISSRACFDLVDVFGFAPEATRSSPGTVADPQFWLEHDLRVDGFRVLTPGGIVLADLEENAPHMVFDAPPG